MYFLGNFAKQTGDSSTMQKLLTTAALAALVGIVGITSAHATGLHPREWARDNCGTNKAQGEWKYIYLAEFPAHLTHVVVTNSSGYDSARDFKVLRSAHRIPDTPQFVYFLDDDATADIIIDRGAQRVIRICANGLLRDPDIEVEQPEELQ